jgi:peptidyl-prolyl cis-trans isomerase B (cyclophilin B)
MILSITVRRAVIYLTALFLFYQCSDKQKSKSMTSVKTDEKKTAAVTEPEPKEDLPLILDQENHKAFLSKYFEETEARKIALTTRLGTIKIELFEDTPIHTANFLMLTERDYFDNTEFTRVVENFVVQGGNNDKEEEEIKRLLIGNYEMQPEMKEEHIHKKGALAMARRYEDNPDMLSSAYNFYIVHGQTFNEPQLMAMEREHEIQIPGWKRDIYKTIGGAPHLDGKHTVFGQVYEGFDVLDKMAAVKTDKSDWPVKPLIMEIEIIE